MSELTNSSPQRGEEIVAISNKSEIKILLDWVVTPPQVRQTIEPSHIQRLAHSIIATNGCENPPIVYKFDRPGFQEYLALIQNIWQIKTDIADFKPVWEKIGEEEKEFFYTVVAGACRTHALRYLRDHGCERCWDELTKGEAGLHTIPQWYCFEHHFHSREVTVRLSKSNDPHAALLDMFAENLYEQPPAHELATGIGLYFRYMQVVDPNITYARFSRECVGWSPAKVSETLRYLALPEYIRRSVEKGEMLYGMAVQLARLQVAGCSDREIEDWYIRIVTERSLTVKGVNERIGKFLREKRSMQSSLDLGEMMFAAQSSEARREQYKRPVMLETLQLMYAMKRWLEKVLELFTNGLLGNKVSPFTEESVTRGMIVVWQIALLVLNHMKWLKESQRQEMEGTFREAIAVAEDLQNSKDKDTRVG